MGLFSRKKSFDDQLQRLLVEAVGPGVEITTVDQDTVQVNDVYIGLTNFRAQWNQLPEDQRVPWLREALPALLDPPTIPDRLETTRPLRPGLRPRAMLEATRLANLDAGPASEGTDQRALIPCEPFGGDLVTVLLWDTPSMMSVIDQDQLDTWMARFDDLLGVAIDNLEDQPDIGWAAAHKQVYTSLDEDDYAGARLLVPGYLDKCGLAGELVVLHPNRSRVIATAVDDARGIRIACELALEELDAPAPVSLQPLVGRSGDWRPLVLSPSHPAYEVWQRLTRLNDQMIHNSLRPHLQALLGDDVFVAAHEVGQSPEGSYHSVTTWTEGIASLLPRTDLVALVTEQGEAITTPWETVRQGAGRLMEPTEHYPELWRVVDFPSAEELVRLRNSTTT